MRETNQSVPGFTLPTGSKYIAFGNYCGPIADLEDEEAVIYSDPDDISSCYVQFTQDGLRHPLKPELLLSHGYFRFSRGHFTIKNFTVKE